MPRAVRAACSGAPTPGVWPSGSGASACTASSPGRRGSSCRRASWPGGSRSTSPTWRATCGRIRRGRSGSSRRGARVKVGLLGGLAAVKGLATVLASARLARGLEQPLAYCVLGYPSSAIPTWPELPIQVRGEYRDADLPDLLALERFDVLWFPGRIPETYSYTLDVALASGLPVVASDLGAVAERLRDEGSGHAAARRRAGGALERSPAGGSRNRPQSRRDCGRRRPASRLPRLVHGPGDGCAARDARADPRRPPAAWKSSRSRRRWHSAPVAAGDALRARGRMRTPRIAPRAEAPAGGSQPRLRRAGRPRTARRASPGTRFSTRPRTARSRSMLRHDAASVSRRRDRGAARGSRRARIAKSPGCTTTSSCRSRTSTVPGAALPSWRRAPRGASPRRCVASERACCGCAGSVEPADAARALPGRARSAGTARPRRGRAGGPRGPRAGEAARSALRRDGAPAGRAGRDRAAAPRDLRRRDAARGLDRDPRLRAPRPHLQLPAQPRPLHGAGARRGHRRGRRLPGAGRRGAGRGRRCALPACRCERRLHRQLQPRRRGGAGRIPGPAQQRHPGHRGLARGAAGRVRRPPRRRPRRGAAGLSRRQPAGGRRHRVARRLGVELGPRRRPRKASLPLPESGRLLFRRLSRAAHERLAGPRRLRSRLRAGLLRGHRSRVPGAAAGQARLLPAGRDHHPLRGRHVRHRGIRGRQASPGDQPRDLPGALAWRARHPSPQRGRAGAGGRPRGRRARAGGGGLHDHARPRLRLGAHAGHARAHGRARLQGELRGRQPRVPPALCARPAAGRGRGLAPPLRRVRGAAAAGARRRVRPRA